MFGDYDNSGDSNYDRDRYSIRTSSSIEVVLDIITVLSDDEFTDLLANDFLLEYTYDSYQGLYDSNSSVSDGINAINEGVGIINYTGHAGPTGWGNGAPLNGSHVNNLTNTDKLPFIFTATIPPPESASITISPSSF